MIRKHLNINVKTYIFSFFQFSIKILFLTGRYVLFDAKRLETAVLPLFLFAIPFTRRISDMSKSTISDGRLRPTRMRSVYKTKNRG